ncbi:MAG: MATE family efflux transporter, partial [Lachnospiraceae bacterium]|nr:MATE family efflux transporter [Lachnospiraceae bacterium]
IPAAIGSILMSVSNIIVNSQMAAYGDMAVAGVGVAMKVTMITCMICMGLGQGIQPLLGFCVGAGTWDRYKKIFRFSLIFSFAVGVILVSLSYIFAGSIVRAFLTDASAFEYGLKFVRILLSTNFFFGVFFVVINALQAMGAAVPSLIINCCRHGIIHIPMLFALEAIMGETGLIWAQPVTDVLSLVLAVILYAITYKKMKKERNLEK